MGELANNLTGPRAARRASQLIGPVDDKSTFGLALREAFPARAEITQKAFTRLSRVELIR